MTLGTIEGHFPGALPTRRYIIKVKGTSNSEARVLETGELDTNKSHTYTIPL